MLGHRSKGRRSRWFIIFIGHNAACKKYRCSNINYYKLIYCDVDLLGKKALIFLATGVCFIESLLDLRGRFRVEGGVRVAGDERRPVK